MTRVAPVAPITAAPVLLTAGETIVARTVCDRYGEFLLEYDPQPQLQLQVVVDAGRRRLELSLDQTGAVSRRSADERRKPVRRSGKKH